MSAAVITRAVIAPHGTLKVTLPNDMSVTPFPTPATGFDYEAAIERFYKPLYRFGVSLSGNESDAADLTQETYQVLLQKAGQIRDPLKVKSWLFTTLYRRFLARRRHAVRYPETSLEAAEWELPTASESHVKRLTGAAIVAALDELPERFGAVLAMFYLQELSYKEIATVLGCPIGTVMSRLSRGKEILRRRLGAVEEKAAGE